MQPVRSAPLQWKPLSCQTSRKIQNTGHKGQGHKMVVQRQAQTSRVSATHIHQAPVDSSSIREVKCPRPARLKDLRVKGTKETPWLVSWVAALQWVDSAGAVLCTQPAQLCLQIHNPWSCKLIIPTLSSESAEAVLSQNKTKMERQINRDGARNQMKWQKLNAEEDPRRQAVYVFSASRARFGQSCNNLKNSLLMGSWLVWIAGGAAKSVYK